jgi:hypothetical protein
LIRTLLPQLGDEVSTSELEADTEETFLDLMAAASFDHAMGDGEIFRWKASLAHERDDVWREAVPRDEVGDWKVERFKLYRPA